MTCWSPSSRKCPWGTSSPPRGRALQGCPLPRPLACSSLAAGVTGDLLRPFRLDARREDDDEEEDAVRRLPPLGDTLRCTFTLFCFFRGHADEREDKGFSSFVRRRIRSSKKQPFETGLRGSCVRSRTLRLNLNACTLGCRGTYGARPVSMTSTEEFGIQKWLQRKLHHQQRSATVTGDLFLAPGHRLRWQEEERASWHAQSVPNRLLRPGKYVQGPRRAGASKRSENIGESTATSRLVSDAANYNG